MVVHVGEVVWSGDHVARASLHYRAEQPHVPKAGLHFVNYFTAANSSARTFMIIITLGCL